LDEAKLEAEAIGDSGDLTADVVDGQCRDDGRDLSQGADSSFCPAESVRPGGEVVVNDDVGQGASVVQQGLGEGAGASSAQHFCGVGTLWQLGGRRADPSSGEERQSCPGRLVAGGVGIGGNDDAPTAQVDGSRELGDVVTG
jgi:hypothetical protein